jgi:hypothetical protein
MRSKLRLIRGGRVVRPCDLDERKWINDPGELTDARNLEKLRPRISSSARLTKRLQRFNEKTAQRHDREPGYDGADVIAGEGRTISGCTRTDL